MQKPYSQLKATLAISKASLISIIRSPAAIVFSIIFPLIFILIFGFLNGSDSYNIKIAFAENSNKNNPVYFAIQQIPTVKIVQDDFLQNYKKLEKGKIVAIIDIQPENTSNAKTPYSIKITSATTVQPQSVFLLKSILNEIIAQQNNTLFLNNQSIAYIQKEIQMIKGTKFKSIDFILPGQLGFSLLSSGIFGVAFLFFNLRTQLILKRIYATPIKKINIVIGEALSRIIFQLLAAIIIIGIGYFCFDYILVKGWITFINMIILSFIGLILFMGIGFIISSIAKSDSTIPPLAQLIIMPQFLLSGTFFPSEAFPNWLQPICKILPLTHFNNAMRNIAFEGANLIDVYKEMLFLIGWIVLIYFIAIKKFKWE